MDAEERERKRISSDLHDGVGQLLSSALFNLNQLVKGADFNNEQAKLAERSVLLLNDGYDEIRAISHQIIPNFLLKYGLAAAVRDFLSKIDEHTIEVSLEISGIKATLGEQLEIQLYRILQESVNNVIKHSRANKLSIQLHKDEDGINLNIEDNGIGFNPKNVTEKTGIGMRNIQSRVAFLKGHLDIQSSPGEGTLLAIFILN